MDLAAIWLAVQRQFGDDTEAQVTTTDITRWANEGQLQIARKTDALLEPFSMSTVAGQSAYTLPVDFLRVDRVTINGAVIYKTSSQDLDRENPSRSVSPPPVGIPTRFYIKRKALCLYPTPDQVYALGADIVVRPAELTTGVQVPEVPVELHPDIVRYCLSRAYELDGQRTDAQAVMSEFDTNLGWAIDEVGNAYSDSYPSIRGSDAD